MTIRPRGIFAWDWKRCRRRRLVYRAGRAVSKHGDVFDLFMKTMSGQCSLKARRVLAESNDITRRDLSARHLVSRLPSPHSPHSELFSTDAEASLSVHSQSKYAFISSLCISLTWTTHSLLFSLLSSQTRGWSNRFKAALQLPSDLSARVTCVFEPWNGKIG